MWPIPDEEEVIEAEDVVAVAAEARETRTARPRRGAAVAAGDPPPLRRRRRRFPLAPLRGRMLLQAKFRVM